RDDLVTGVQTCALPICVHVIVKETARATQMLQNLLQFSRPNAMERKPCRLEDQVRAALELKAYDLRRDRVTVVTELEPVAPVLEIGRASCRDRVCMAVR